MKKIFLNQPCFGKEEINAAYQSLKNLRLSQGIKVSEFENSFSSYIGCKYGIATNSGSSANLIALAALKEYYKIPNGSEVIIPATTFATVAMPIIQIGLKPVYVDVSLETLNIDCKEVEAAISKKTKIIMPVHTLGLPTHIDKIKKIAKKNKLIIFEDCCEAHGASINNKKVGSFGEISAFSFFVAHNITTGEGGMVLTNNKKLMLICRSLREFGRVNQQISNENKRYISTKKLKKFDRRYVFERLGYNMRMTDIAGSIGVEQTKKLDLLNKIRVDNAKYLTIQLEKNFKNIFYFQKYDKSYYHCYYGFPISINQKHNINRHKFLLYLEKMGIETRPIFAGCLPDQPAFEKEIGKSFGKLKNSRIIKNNSFFIGIHPKLKKGDLDYIIYTFKKYLKIINFHF